jgi:hypothetical protein
MVTVPTARKVFDIWKHLVKILEGHLSRQEAHRRIIWKLRVKVFEVIHVLPFVFWAVRLTPAMLLGLSPLWQFRAVQWSHGSRQPIWIVHFGYSPKTRACFCSLESSYFVLATANDHERLARLSRSQGAQSKLCALTFLPTFCKPSRQGHGQLFCAHTFQFLQQRVIAWVIFGLECVILFFQKLKPRYHKVGPVGGETVRQKTNDGPLVCRKSGYAGFWVYNIFKAHIFSSLSFFAGWFNSRRCLKCNIKLQTCNNYFHL